MKIERVELSKLAADPANVRKHNSKNLKAIEASLRRFGQQKPIVVDGDGIVRAGNGTLAAAQQLGWTHIDIVRTSLKGADATAYAIADNRTAELAEWDEEALAQQLAAIQIEDEDLVVDTGFDVADLNAMQGTITHTSSTPESSTEEVDVDGFSMENKCPKCGFEFDAKA
jgi:ParB-like chromosome segregation protein Spo0J